MKGYKGFLSGLLTIIILMIYPGFQYSLWDWWHTVKINERSFPTFLIVGLLSVIVCIYFVLERKGIVYKTFFILLHFLLTFLPVFWLFFSQEIIKNLVYEKSIDKILDWGILILYMQVFSYLAFISGQIVFLIVTGIAIWKNRASH